MRNKIIFICMCICLISSLSACTIKSDKKISGGAGLPDYEGYVYKWVITDKDGNRFKIWGDSKDSYYDDYQKVLDGEIYYNENGEHVYYDDNGDILFVSDY